jgi:trigger factor
MEPAEFIQVLDSNGQLPAMIGEVARSKALAYVLSKATVVDTAGKSVDVSAFAATGLGDGEAGDDAEALVGASDSHGHVGNTGGRDNHGRKPGHEHYGHDHK